jgi:molybdopterin/thiamine biosynthesis adenylyltransferase
MKSWTQSYPDRLAYELADFARRGLDFRHDESALAEQGVLVLRGRITWREAEVELVVVYPDSFPFLRPEVYAPKLTLDRHQNPFEHTLCLLDRSTRAWCVSDTGAWLVAERVTHLLDLLESGGETLLEGEAPQGEPASYYFQARAGATIFIPEEMLDLPGDERVGILEVAFGQNEPPQQLVRGCLARLAVRSRKGKKQTLAELTDPVRTRFSGRRLEGRWVRLERFPTGNEPVDLATAITNIEPSFAHHHWQPLGDGAAISLLGAVIPEEVGQGEWEDSWLFLVSLRNTRTGAVTCYTARGERLTARDLQARLPASSRLDGKHVGVAGLGALGAPIATELLRSQVGGLHVLDGDRVEAGNIVRWPFGLSAVGHAKASVVAGWALAEQPLTVTRGWIHRIGALRLDGVPPPGGMSEMKVLTEFLDGLDLLIDATAELGVQHLLSTLSDKAGIPQVYAWGTEGGWGGVVARVVPGKTGCWYCLQLALDEGTIALPPAAPAALIQPRGCAEPTFAAASYALTPIVAQTVRVAARTLRGASGQDVFVCQIEDDHGELPAPCWSSYALEVHERCPCGHQAIAA